MAEYIDRTAALSFPFANGEYDHEHANEHFIYGCETYKEWLEQLPVADMVEVKMGKWEQENIVLTSYPPQYQWHCSKCGEIKQGFDSGILTNYCPNCGAKMDEEAEK